MSFIRVTAIGTAVCLLALPISVCATEYFDPGLLQSVNGNSVISDTKALSAGGQPAGNYQVNIFVNGNKLADNNIRFDLDESKNLVACLTYKNYQKMGVDMKIIDNTIADNSVSKVCTPIEQQVPGATANFDFAKLELDVSIPQDDLIDETLTGVPYELWDEGIPSIINEYQLSGEKYISRRNNVTDSFYANLLNGVNLGRWRYRNSSTISNTNKFDSITNYVETAIQPLKAELTLGDASTDGDIFDSIQLRGIQLASSQDMIPDQLIGFSPVIHGIAKSNALVSVKANDSIIYQRSVPPGPFTIRDLSSVSNGGKMELVIREANGAETHSTIVYSTIPQLLREGQLKYNFATGGYTSNTNNELTEIAQFTLSWGLPFDSTIYGGNQLSDEYKASNIGLGTDFKKIGSIAVDITHSKYTYKNDLHFSGDMARLTYRNEIAESNTQIQLDNRYYFDDFVSFSDSKDLSSLQDNPHKRREYNFTLNQNITDEGSLFVTLGRTENFDDSVSRMTQFGWSGYINYFSFSITYSMTKNEHDPLWDKQLALTFSVPLDGLYPVAQPVVNYTMTSGLHGDATSQMGVTGEVANMPNTRWNSNVGYASQHEHSDTQSGSVGVDYLGRDGDAEVNYNSNENNYISWNASGSLIAHKHGITAGKYSSNSQALVEIPGVENVVLENGENVITDYNGYAIVSDLQDYHHNILSIDTQTVKNIDFATTALDIVPTKDAIVLAKFAPILGHKVVFIVKKEGAFLPFGALAHIDGSDQNYYVGEQGQVYVNAESETGLMKFTWGDSYHCSSPYDLSKPNKSNIAVTLIPLTYH